MTVADCIPEVIELDAHVFQRDFLLPAKPVLLKGFAQHWPACGKWSPDFFAAEFGDARIEVITGAIRRPESGVPASGDRSTLTIREFVAAIAPVTSQDLYLVAQSGALRLPELQRLWTDLDLENGFFAPADRAATIKLWMGPAGTVTRLHHDLQDALLLQLHGRKQVHLLSPAETPFVYNQAGGYAQVDPELPDFSCFPLFANATVHTIVIEPGDALLLPHRWWHQVRALTPSVSLSIACLAGSRQEVSAA